MALSRICKLIESATGDRPPFPPTEIFNEGWLVRLLVDWFAHNYAPESPLGFAPEARWFSEALLPSAFLARFKGDPLAESWTHADAVIGHFEIGVAGSTDCALWPGAKQLVVIEAKVFSKLAAGVTKAPDYDQAARSVACIAELLKRAGRRPSSIDRLGFYVLAPASQIEDGVFAALMEKSSVESKVHQRVAAYEGSKNDWYHAWFAPTLERIDVQQISWEAVIAQIPSHDPESAKELSDFYSRCLDYK